jgi:hypothetical protein
LALKRRISSVKRHLAGNAVLLFWRLFVLHVRLGSLRSRMRRHLL